MENRINIPTEEVPNLKEGQEEGGKSEKKEKKEKGKGIPVREVNRYVGYVVFMVFIGLVYIWSSHLAEKQVRKEEALMVELREMKAEYKTFHSRLSSGTRKSEIAKKVAPLGLKIPETPPYKIIQKD